MKHVLTSYSQFGEDIKLFSALRNEESVFYIDAGANDPQSNSATKLFYDRGGHGINIEPQKFYIDDYGIYRTRDINLQVGLSDQEGELTLNGSGLEASFIKGHANSKLNTERCKVYRLDQICEKYIDSDQQIHFLKIDVEHYEEKVINGMDFKKFRPWILMIEYRKENPWEESVLKSDYIFVMQDELNKYYVAKEHSDIIEEFKEYDKLYEEFEVLHYSEGGLMLQLSEIRESFCWKITKPIRMLGRPFFRKL